MKKLFLLLAVLLAIPATAQNYFGDGMKWESKVSGSSSPFPETHIETVYLQGDTIVNGAQCLKMWSVYDNDASTLSLVTVIRREGEKILFLPEPSAEWATLYDFGLKEGEGCTITVPQSVWMDREFPNIVTTYVKCVRIANEKEYGDWPVMELEEYNDEGVLLGRGKWLKGLSSANGVLQNGYFEVDGVSGNLLMEVSDAGNVYYSNANAGVSEMQDSESGYRIYNLQGLEVNSCVSSLPKGIYIVNGKKVLK